jgi:lipoate-protein ligase A
MKLLDWTLPTPEENLACDEALLDECEAGRADEILRFWEPAQSFVVVGYGNKVASEVNEAFCEAKRIPILRRCTGGGTVLQGPGCLNYSLVLRIGESGQLDSIVGANRFILGRHQGALAALAGARVDMQGQTDLAIGGRKFSGNAQRRRKQFLLFHGTFLLDFDIALVEGALRLPERQPAYRAERSHADFLMNLKAPAERVKAALARAWGATEGQAGRTGRTSLTGRIERLVGERYARDDWNFRL